MVFVFDECTLDVDRRELRRAGIVRSLEPKGFLVLMHLLAQRHRAVSKDELLVTCWPNEFVTETALTRCLRVIRQAVGDDGMQQHCIKTLRGYGYRFVAAVEERATRAPDRPWSQLESPHRAATTAHAPDQHASTPQVTPPRYLTDQSLTMRRALAGERKQVTVLCVEIVGYRTLTERLEPEDLLTLVGGCFALLDEQVHQYAGTITQFTNNSLIALFSASMTHEDHAGRALHAALNIQGALREYQEEVERGWGVPLQTRLGLHTGTVVVGRIGESLRMDYTVQGETTRLAVWLQQMAPPVAIWGSEATYRAARDAFVWQAVGLMAVQGQTTTVSVYAPVSPREARSRFAGRTRQE